MKSIGEYLDELNFMMSNNDRMKIIKAFKKYGDDRHNAALDLAANEATINDENYQDRVWVDKESIFKLKLKIKK